MVIIRKTTKKKIFKVKYRPRLKLRTNLFLIISLALTAINSSCSGTKKTNIKTEMNQTTKTLIAKFDVSAKTRQLIQDIQDELSLQKTSISKYVPSKSVIVKYDLIKIDNLYYISGMMSINETLDNNSLKEIGVKTGYQSGNINTIQIPVNKFDLFLKNTGIKYFELTEKVKTN